METHEVAAPPEERTVTALEEDSPVLTPRMRLRAILDIIIVGLMIAILLTLSLPVCIAFVEQNQAERAAQAHRMQPARQHAFRSVRFLS